MEGGADVVPVVAQRGLDLLLGGEDQLGVVGQQVEQLAEVADGEQLGDVRAFLRALERRDLGELPMLGRELGGGGDLHRLRVAERALGERGEPAQRLDLVVEQVDADRALLGRRIDVEQPAAHGELAAIVDLVDALVAGGDEVGGRLVEVEQLAEAEREAVRAQRRVGDLLAERDRGDDDDRRLLPFAAVEHGVEGGDAQADEVRRRRQVRLVGDAAARVEADGARAQPGPQVLRELACGAVVAGDDDRRLARVALRHRGDEVRAQALRDERAGARLGEPLGVGMLLELAEERAQGHGERPPGSSRAAGVRRG